jgi:hypothetical protein
MKEGHLSQPNEPVLIKELKRSGNPLRQLRKNLVWNLFYHISGIVAFTYLIFHFSALSIRVTLGILVLVLFFFSLNLYWRVKAFDKLLNTWDQPILEILRSQLILTRKTIRLKEIYTLLFLPFAFLAGLLIGGSAKGFDADDLIKDFNFLSEGMGLALLTMPLFFFYIKWMNKKSFLDFVHQTEKMLKEWES